MNQSLLRKTVQHSALALVLLATACATVERPFSWAQVSPPSPAASTNGALPRKEPNKRIVTDPDGRRFVETRWPLGSPDNVVRLRVPHAYVWWGGAGFAAALGPNYRDPNVVGPHLDTFILEALLPDLAPKTPENADKFKDGISGQVVEMVVNNTATSNRRGAEFIDYLFRFNLPLVLTPAAQKRLGLTFRPKPDHFSLKRMGPIGDFEQFRQFGAVDDIYFPEKDPKELFITCGAEEIRDRVEDSTWQSRPICSHKFYSASLQAVVKLVYRRIYLPEWQTIQERAEQLLASFETTSFR